MRNIDDMRPRAVDGYAWAAGAVAPARWRDAMHPRFDVVNIAMVYLLAVVSLRCAFHADRRSPRALCRAAFDVLFVPPRGRLTIDDLQYVLTFVIILGVALVISRLVDSVRAPGDGTGRARTRGRDRADPQRPARVDLARPAHTARRDCRRPRRASPKTASGSTRRRAARLAQSVFDQARGNVRARRQGAADDAARNRRHRARARLG
jgi:two-component system sensor histidine kinase KdpD